MNMKKLANAQMNETELEFIVGGAGFVYIMKRDDGKFDVASSEIELDPAKVKAFLQLKPVDKSMNNAITHAYRDVTSAQLERVKNHLNGVYNGCKFFEI